MESDKLTFREGIELSYDLMYQLLDQQRELTAGDLFHCMQEIFNELLDVCNEKRNEELKKYFNIEKNWSNRYLTEKMDPIVKVVK